MKKTIFLLLFIMNACISNSQNETPCNKNVNSRDLLKRLPVEVCIPKGYTIFNVIDSVDLNRDDLKDVVVEWANLPFTDGDTTFYSIYSQGKDSIFKLDNTYDNLQSIYLTSRSKGQSALLDYLRKLYTGNTTVVFSKNKIIVKFPTTWDFFGKSYIFEYNSGMNTWVLSLIQYWVGNIEYGVINRYNWSEEYHKEHIMHEKIPKEKIKIGDFDLTKVMIVEGEEDWFYYNASKKYEWFD